MRLYLIDSKKLYNCLMNTESKRIAIVRLSALGDIINSTIVLQFIKKHYPTARIEWITEEAFAPLVQQLPDVDVVRVMPIKRIKKERSLSLLNQSIRQLKALGEYDVIIDMQGLLKSAITARLIGKNVHGYSKKSARESLAASFYASTSEVPYSENIIKRNIKVVSDALNFTVTDQEILDKKPTLPIGNKPKFIKTFKEKIVTIVAGASWESKKYPKEQLVEICNALDVRIILTWGNQEEFHEAVWLAERAHRAIVAPELNLVTLSHLIAHSDLIIGSDTGPTHMAWALNRPSITLFGPTTSRMMYETPINIALKSPSEVDLNNINKQDFSIKEISVESIVKHAEALL